MVLTTGQLHNAFSDFVLHLRDRAIETDLEISEMSERVSLLEQGGGGGGGVGSDALRAHLLSPEPHVAYDRDLPNLTVLFNNVIA